VPVPAGDGLSRSDVDRLKRAQHNAEVASGLRFSVFVGVSEEDSRAYAERLHNALDDPARSVLVLCDPGFHALEIVTGAEARRALPDVECRLAAASMQTSFVGGDIIGGLVNGVQQLGESARQPRTLHVSHL
jgi:alkanesulfonate monooxygenase SsuD/methylene tetrahydromethanopterin reductase-like flavin-dependent oxidoreductase (luciferase family)